MSVEEPNSYELEYEQQISSLRQRFTKLFKSASKAERTQNFRLRKSAKEILKQMDLLRSLARTFDEWETK